MCYERFMQFGLACYQHRIQGRTEVVDGSKPRHAGASCKQAPPPSALRVRDRWRSTRRVQFVSDRCPITPRKHDKKQANVEDAVGAGFLLLTLCLANPLDHGGFAVPGPGPAAEATRPAPRPLLLLRVESWCLTSDGQAGKDGFRIPLLCCCCC